MQHSIKILRNTVFFSTNQSANILFISHGNINHNDDSYDDKIIYRSIIYHYRMVTVKISSTGFSIN